MFCDNEQMKAFFDTLYCNVANMEVCEAHAIKAIAVIADQIRLGRAEIELNAPRTKFRPNGEYHHTVLFDRKEGINTKSYDIVFSIPDGGKVPFSSYPFGEEFYSVDEKELHTLLFREIFQQYSRIMMQKLLLHIMQTDLATGVASPEALMQFATKLIAQKQIQEFDVVFFNIHNFKYVNKVFSYEQGDVILRNYAVQVQGLLKEDEMVARLGGDNFVAIVRKEHQEEIVNKLLNVRLTHVTPIKEKEFIFGATIGISGLENVEVPREVMARASIAYQAARQRGTGSVVFFSPEIQRSLMETQSIISNFILALEAEEFVVYYQPKVAISTKTICGAEALVRWMRNGQLIPPMKFLPQLEREGSICRLDYYVLEQTCKFLKTRMERGKPMVCISVNFSRRHLEEDNMVERVIEIIDRYGIDHKYIEIELTESEDFQNYEIMSQVVNGLRDSGIGTSIDDFGTGFSSLNMIKQVDLNVIKIDKSFIPLEQEYPGKKKDMIMFCNIVGLVKQLGKKTIAEGVETEEQLEYLKEVGCDIVQGYVFDKPLSKEKFEERLENGYEAAVK